MSIIRSPRHGNFVQSVCFQVKNIAAALLIDIARFCLARPSGVLLSMLSMSRTTDERQYNRQGQVPMGFGN